MTAVIGLLNKSGLAIAADSASTYSNGRSSKTINNANKIFTLSKFNPVAIAIYNSATLVDTPWEILVKEYRRVRKDNTFDNLSEYVNDFYNFLLSQSQNLNLSLNEARHKQLIEVYFKGNLEKIQKELKLELKEENKSRIKEALIKLLNSELEGLRNENRTSNIGFENLEFSEFNTSFRDWILNSLPSNIWKFLGFQSDETNTLIEIFYFIFIRSYYTDYQQWTGLVFLGFGDKEIYPNCISTKVSGVFNRQIRHYIDLDGSAQISPTMNAAIRPFAQRDVIDTILGGVNQKLENHYLNLVVGTLGSFKAQIANIIRPDLPDLAGQLDSLDHSQIIQDFAMDIQNYKKNNHFNPLMDTISGLTKDDLADVAESLVYLTYLKRRITSAQESVGGPIDVAVITKGDGFIWIKRKHYFNPELNTNFVNNYLNL